MRRERERERRGMGKYGGNVADLVTRLGSSCVCDV